MSTQEADPWLTINPTIEGKLPNFYWEILNKSLTNTRQNTQVHIALIAANFYEPPTQTQSHVLVEAILENHIYEGISMGRKIALA
jgi:hypothetical protein